jgi:hypothetical protein
MTNDNAGLPGRVNATVPLVEQRSQVRLMPDAARNRVRVGLRFDHLDAINAGMQIQEIAAVMHGGLRQP